MQSHIKYLTLALVLLLTACNKLAEDPIIQNGKTTQVVVHFTPPASIESSNAFTRAAEYNTQLRAIWYIIFDAQGNKISPRLTRLETDLSKLTVEGLSHGTYTFLFLATCSNAADSEPYISDLNQAANAWLENGGIDSPMNQDFLYLKKTIEVSISQPAMQIDAQFERSVGQVVVDIVTTSQYMNRFIRDVKFTLNESDAIYTSFSGLGEYSGSGTIKNFDITATKAFYTLPSTGKVSGTVQIVSETLNGTTFTKQYTFKECTIEAGKITHISVVYEHPENNSGFFHVRQTDYALTKCDTMFLDKEPRAVFYDTKKRSFYPQKPLQATIDENHQLHLKFFSPIAIQDVLIQCRFKKYSSEFVDFAKFDYIYPFQEYHTPIPLVSASRTFTLASGRKIEIPAQPNLTAEDVEFRVVCNDPFIQKTSAITSSWYISFSGYAADSNHPYWLHMTPEFCRHGVALALNMAYMFSTEQFETELQKYDGILKDDAGNPINLTHLKTNIRNHSGLTLGLVQGVGGLGGGSTYGLASYCYRGVYFDATPLNSNPHNYDRMAMFHEYGHCLGYGHDSNMTYGDVWTVLCANTFVDMGKKGLLPVNSKDAIGLLPR